MSGKFSAGISEVVSKGVCESGFKPVHFAQPANARQPSNIRAVRGIFMFSSQVPDVPELIFLSLTPSTLKKFDSDTFG